MTLHPKSIWWVSEAVSHWSGDWSSFLLLVLLWLAMTAQGLGQWFSTFYAIRNPFGSFPRYARGWIWTLLLAKESMYHGAMTLILHRGYMDLDASREATSKAWKTSFFPHSKSARGRLPRHLVALSNNKIGKSEAAISCPRSVGPILFWIHRKVYIPPLYKKKLPSRLLYKKKQLKQPCNKKH